MNYSTLERILSNERLAPYLSKHNGDHEKAIQHYKANIKISESFYAGIAILEVGLRNNIDLQLRRKYSTVNWFDSSNFLNDVSNFQIDRIHDARRAIIKEKKTAPSTSASPGAQVTRLIHGRPHTYITQFSQCRCIKNVKNDSTLHISPTWCTGDTSGELMSPSKLLFS